MLPVKNRNTPGSFRYSFPQAQRGRSASRRAPASRCLRTGLHVEQPDPDCAADEEHGPLHEQVGAPADCQAERRDDQREHEVRRQHAVTNAPACPARHDAGLQYEHEEPAKTEHDERVAEEPVRDLPPRGKGAVLADGQRGDVAHATPVEVACGRMAHGMLAPPAAVRQPHEQAQRRHPKCHSSAASPRTNQCLQSRETR